jgi:hypothetical protein
MSPDPTDLVLDTEGWAEGTAPDGHAIFARPPDDLLITQAFHESPALPLHDLDELLVHLGEPLAEIGASMVSLGTTTIDGVPSLEMVYTAPKSVLGTVYVGVVTIPVRDQSFVIKVMCRDSGSDEHPMERLRDHLDRLSATTTLSDRVKL